MAIALFLINAPYVAAQALRLVIAGWFAVDAAGYAFDIIRSREAGERSNATWAALGNVVAVVLILLARGWLLTWAVAIAGALRIFGITWSIIVAPVYTTAAVEQTLISELGLADQPGAAAMAAELEAAERRAPIDRGWTLSFIITLFAIHIGRMSADLTLLGLLSPAVAVAGDMLVAASYHSSRHQSGVPAVAKADAMESSDELWRCHPAAAASGDGSYLAPSEPGCAGGDDGDPVARTALLGAGSAQSRVAARLPFAAILAATVPIWGMSWYFDTENWAAGMWNSWAESRYQHLARVDGARRAGGGGRRAPGQLALAVDPAGIDSGDFSFVVIGRHR